MKKAKAKSTGSKPNRKAIRDLDSKKPVKGGAAKKTTADATDWF